MGKIYKVVTKYKDKYTKQIMEVGTEIELTSKRVKELNTGKTRVEEIIEPETEVEPETEAENGEN